MYAIRNRADPRIFFHWPLSTKKRVTRIPNFLPNKPPRLFEKHYHARIALNSWLAAGHSPVNCLRMGISVRSARDWEIIEVEVRPINETKHALRAIEEALRQ
jgi:hypothetical protein